MLYDTIAAHFHHHIERLSLSVDTIAEVTENAAIAATEAIISEHKLMSCAVGPDAGPAIAFRQLLNRGHLRERPALPVVELCAPQLRADEGAVNWLATQLTTLGQPGDVAVIFGSTLADSDLEMLEQILVRREVMPVYIGAAREGQLAIELPNTAPGVALSLSMACAVCLSEIIDITTFGPLENL